MTDTARFLATEDGEFNGNAPVPPLRLENTREHIARDMCEGRFPTRSPVAFTFTDEVVHQVYLDLCIGLIDHEKVRLALNANLLSAQPHPVETVQADVQPVVWQMKSKSGEWTAIIHADVDWFQSNRYEIRKLYSHATVAALNKQIDELKIQVCAPREQREFDLARAADKETFDAALAACQREKEGLREGVVGDGADILTALKTALREQLEAMNATDRDAFNKGLRGPSWMFTARDAIKRVEGEL